MFAPRTIPDFIEPLTEMEFVFIKGGTFMMGDTAGDGHKRELPAHTVLISDFAVGLYEVTFAQYDEFCEATGREKPSDEGWGRGNRPVINVSWHDATAFTEWLSKQGKHNYSLPSEAQWEYFARAATTTSYWMGEGVGSSQANCEDCGSRWDGKSTAPVGSFYANPWGLYDTAGNVHEWCQDSLHRNYQNAPQNGQAWLNGDGAERINRGGAWNSKSKYLRSAARDYRAKNLSQNDIGFRIVLELVQKDSAE